MKFTTSDIPQADRLEKVIHTVEAVKEGSSTEILIAGEIGFSERQARYYRKAAQILGFIENNHNNATVTELGVELADSNQNEKNYIVRKAICQNPLFTEIIKYFEQNKDGLTEVDIKTFLASISDNDAQSTIPRRVKTILSWLEDIEVIIESGENYQFNDTLDLNFDEKLAEESIYPANYSKEVDIKEDKFSVFELIRKLNQDKVVMNPDFQRNLVWKQHQKSQFIESIILNIPLPPFYFKKDLKGKYVIIDGLQRTSTLKTFTDRDNEDYFPLSGLNALPKLNGKYFHELEDDERSRIEDKNLLIYLLQPSVPMVVVYDIFNRINTGGTQLERQEIRNCIFIGESTKLLKRLAESDHFKNAIDNGISPTRMKDREAVLRCLAFRIFDYQKDYSNSIDDLLERAMKKINLMNKEEIKVLEKDFKRVMTITFDFFHGYNFRLPTDYSRGRINIAIMESVFNYFAKKDDAFFLENRSEIYDNYVNKLLLDDKYIDSVRYSTGSTSKVKTRFSLVEQILENF